MSLTKELTITWASIADATNPAIVAAVQAELDTQKTAGKTDGVATTVDVNTVTKWTDISAVEAFVTAVDKIAFANKITITTNMVDLPWVSPTGGPIKPDSHPMIVNNGKLERADGVSTEAIAQLSTATAPTL